MRRLLLATLLTGCSSTHAIATPAAPFAPDAPRAALFTAAPPLHPATPLSIGRLLAESRTEASDLATLTKPLPDARGRERAAAEVSALADELRNVEELLRTSGAESAQLDDIATRLQLLQTRLGLLHERLRVAALPSTAVQVE